MNSLPEEYGNAIAIIGMAGRFPGANSLEAFWQNLQAGVASTTFFSDEALIEMGVKPELLAHPDFVKAGAVLDNIECFDAEFFGFNRREAALMDPQHRLFLECAWEAFENAGINPLTYPGPVGVYAGTSESSYKRINLSAHVDPVDRAAQLQTFLGNDKDHLPIRVSYKLNLTGPSLSVQTACSTSLVAVHVAAQGLLNGECDLALAGGVSIRLPQAGYIYQEGLITSPDGYCRSFDAKGEGAIFGSGLGIVVLKRLDDALVDGDRVEAIIRGSAINNDGARKVGYTAPSEEGQSRVIAEALAVAEVEPESISYVEAHGTATPLGDPIEIAGLTRAFDTPQRQFCAIGSVKSNVGHLEVAAGIAGLIKTVLALKHKMLPPSLHFETANPQIDFASTPFYVNTTLREWPTDGQLRRAGVSSFGMGGTNAHVVLEEAPTDLRLWIDDCRIETSSQDSEIPAKIDNLKSPIVNRQSHQLFTVSAKTEAALNRLVDRYEKHLTTNPTLRIEDVCYTANTGRTHFDHRLSVVATSCAELREKLRQHREGLQPEGVWQGRASVPPSHLQQPQTDEPLTLHRLAELYVTGLDIDWAGLDGNDAAKRHKVALPTYPFAQERCWISNNEQNNSSLIPHPSSLTLHPLVHQNISDLIEQRFRSVFSGNEFFLEDHQVRGQKVFAGAAYLEMVRAAGEMAVRNKTVTQLKDVIWAKPIIVDEEPLETYISLYPDEMGEITFEVSTGEPPQRVVHSQGKITIEAVRQPEPLDITAIQARCSATLSGADCYHYFDEQGLAYGPAFQGLVQISYGEREVLAHLRLPPEVTDEMYGLHPSLLDAALQATIGLALSQRPKELHLPFGLQSLTIHQTPPERAYAYVRYNDSIKPNGPLVKYDITLADEQGNVCVALHGFTGRAMSTPSPNDLFYSTPNWQVKSLIAGDDEIGEPQMVNTSLWVAGLNPPTIESIAATFKQAEVIVLNSVEDVISLVQQGWSQLKILIEKQPRTTHQILVVLADTVALYLYAPLAGLLKSARLEQPHIRGKVVTIASLNEQRLLPLLRQEMRGDTFHEVEIRYDDVGTRAVKTLSEIEPAPQEKMAYLRPGGVYWITGGLGALGRIFARHCLEQSENITIILSGRSALDEIGRQHLAQLNGVGGKVTYLQADISVRADVDRTLHIIREQYGALNGIMHCAGIINDSLIINKSEADLAAVLAPKVIGTLNLDAATQSEPLDFVVLFSSIAGVLGNVGQADYAAANAFLDAFAHHRQTLVTEGRRQGRTLSVNWPLWSEGGMTVDDQSAAWLMHETGLTALNSQMGVNAFEVALGLKQVSQIMVLTGDQPKIKAYLGRAADQVSGREAGKSLDAAEKSALTEAAVKYLKEILAGDLNLSADRVQANAPWESYGIDSVMALSLTRRLEQRFGELPKTLFFEYRTLAELSGYFVEAHAPHLQELPGSVAESASPEKTTALISTSTPRLVSQQQRWLSRPTANAAPQPDEIAIIGLSGRYPMADNLAEFWENLKQGRDCITEVPPERWDHGHYYDQDKTKPGRSYSKWGGFMAGVDQFDPLFFNISPRDAEQMDPQERLFLETAWATLEDAGYTRETLFRQLGRRVGVFVGVMWGEYQLYGQAEVQTTSSYASIANRVSYYFDWQGPSLAVDTMCSSSLTSIHLACESIKRGECAAALAGGVNISIHPNKYLQLAQGKFASSDGRCRSFGEGGDGYVPGEGVGAVLLKPLSQAKADGDQIYGVIKASSLNHGGRTHGYSVPNPRAQANLIGETLQKSGVSARTISYVEAHGTGTALGDPIEISGLSQAFGIENNGDPTCAIGSVKSNIGHLEAAAGIAGLTKVLLQMKHQQLVPSLHTETLNPHIDFAATPFKVQRDLVAWNRPVVDIDGTQQEYPRRAGISSFGAGGANAHLVVEEYQGQGLGVRGQGSGDGQPQVIVLSARNEDRLRAYAARMLNFVESSLDISLADMAYTLQVGRETMPARLALVVADIEGLVERLRRYCRQITSAEDVYQGNTRITSLEANHLVEGEAGAAFLKMVIDNRDLPKLAQLWVSGADIPWSMLYSGQTPRRILLPTYPFARERYWIPDTKTEADEHGVLYSTPIWHPQELVEFIETTETDLTATSLIIVAGVKHTVVETLTATFEQAQIVTLPSPSQDVVGNVSAYLHEVWRHLQTLLQHNPGAPRQILIVVPETDQGYMYAPLAGLMKTACLEHPNIRGKVITIANLATRPPNNLITLLRREAQPDTFQAIEVRYGDGRAVKQLVEITPVQIEPERAWLRPGGVYWITGGRGALGRIFARYLVEHGEAITVILSGRSPLDEAGQETLGKFSATGAATVTYLQADISRIEDVERVVETIKGRYGALNGIIHTAGLLRDAFILKKNLAEIDVVLAPKVAGLVNIDAVTRAETLDFMVLFSSIAGVRGNIGQGDYAAANAFLDAFAAYRQQLVQAGKRSGKTATINWPLWQSGGMQVDEPTLNLLRQRLGLIPLKTKEGLHAFELALAVDESQLVVTAGETTTLRAKLFSNSQSENWLDTAGNVWPVKLENVETTPLRESVVSDLRKMVSKLLKIKPQDLSEDEGLHDYGFDSVTLTVFSHRLNETYGLELAPTLFFQYNTLSALSLYLVEHHADKLTHHYSRPQSASDAAPIPQIIQGQISEHSSPNSDHKKEREVDRLPQVRLSANAYLEETAEVKATSHNNTPIAVIGISGIMPGSPDLEAFWQNLITGQDLITEIPSERWDWRDYYGDPAQDRTKTLAKWGGFIPDVDKFDPLFFKISPKEAQMMDPQHRLFLQAAWHCLEDAGYRASDWSGRRVGVYAGVQFQEYLALANRAGETNAPLVTGNSHAILANRISYLLNLRGPSEAIDTACSSSLVAIHRAVRSIRSGEVESAIAGGVALALSPQTVVDTSQLGVLSPDGRCKTFDRRANGFVKGEGVGVVLLKPLAQAQADGDHIYGVIRGSAENHGGKAASLTAPNPEAQAELLVSAYEDAAVDIETIGYIEVHGTGTELGDPVEIEGLKQAFQTLRNRQEQASNKQNYCGLGAVKTNIGHLEAAAGIAGLLKVLLAMKYKQLPPTINFESQNPYINLKESPFYLVTTAQMWQPFTDDQGNPLPRRAGVSSFGFGGTNAHVVLEEYIPEQWNRGTAATPADPVSSAPLPPSSSAHMVVLSARNDERLNVYAEKLRDFLTRAGDISLADMAYTLQVGREAMASRVAFLVNNEDELGAKLDAFISGQDSIEHCYRGQVQRADHTFQLFTADEDIEEAISKWIAKRKLDKLAGLWTSGLEIDWHLLYRNHTPRRVSLPTYPFAKERYWLPHNGQETVKNSQFSILNSPFSIDALHPLVQRNTSKLTEQRFSSVFSGAEFFLNDHRVAGEKMLPGVIYLEMARAAGALAVENGTVTQIKDVVWLRPLVIKGEPGEMHISLRPAEGDEVAYAISSLESHGQSVVHSQGRLSFEAAVETDQIIDLEAIRQRCPETKSGEMYYRQFEKHGVAYGPAFQVIEAIVGNNNMEALARLRLPTARGDEAYVLHPSLLDGALQSVIGLTSRENVPHLGPYLPFALDSLELLRPLPDTGYAYVTRLASEPETAHFNIALLDDEGRVCLKFYNFILKAMTQPEPGLYYQPYWDRQVLPEAPPKTIVEGEIVLVLPKELEAFGEALADHYPQQRVVHFFLGDKNVRLSETALEIDLTDSAGMTDSLKMLSTIDTLYFLGGLSGQPSSSMDLKGLARRQEQGVISLFRLIKVLEQHGLMAHLSSLKVLTDRVQPHLLRESVQPWSAALSGLTLSLAKEYPAIEVSCLDVALTVDEAGQVGLDATDMAAIVAEWGHQSPLLALRQGIRYVRRLAPLTLPAAEALPYRPGGVYLILGGAGGIGQEMAVHLAKQVQAKVVLVGRSDLTPQKAAELKRITIAGGEYLYCQTDGTDLAQMQEVVRQSKAKFGAIHGVIHSALVLKDGAISTMDEATFRAVLAPKVAGSMALAKAVQDEALDFMLFFSSSQSFLGDAGQGNYAAGSTFADALTLYLNQVRPYPVKVINWGYWGSVGVVATDVYRRRLAQQGVRSIEVTEGMAAIDQILAGPLTQTAVVKADRAVLAQTGVTFERRIEAVPPTYESVMAEIVEQLTADTETIAPDKMALTQEQAGFAALEEFALMGLLAAFQQMGALQDIDDTYSREELADRVNIVPGYQRFYAACLTLLAQAGYLNPSETGITPLTKLAHRNGLTLAQQQAILADRYPLVQPHLKLLERCLQALPEIVQGHIPATEVIFPNSSQAFVEGIYHGTPVSDYFNRLTAGAVESYIRKRLPTLKAGEKIRIVEVGAGTGGTTSFVLAALEPHRDRIEYLYTDVSQSFVGRGQSRFGAQYPFVKFDRLDITHSPAAQGFDLNQAEIVLGANVVHATRNIQATLQNLKALLKTNGLLILNEVTRFTTFTTLTFGLLDGWWAFEDEKQRIEHTPLLDPMQWQRVLQAEGFNFVHLAGQEIETGQVVVIAESDGICSRFIKDHAVGRKVQPQADYDSAGRSIRLAKANHRPPLKSPVRKSSLTAPGTADRQPTEFKAKPEQADDLAADLAQTIITQVASATGLRPDQIDRDRSFAEYGIDSIVGIELINGISQAIGWQLRTTALFDYPTVHRLADYILSEYGSTITTAPVASQSPNPPVAGTTTPVEKLFAPRFTVHDQAKAIKLNDRADATAADPTGAAQAEVQAAVIRQPGDERTLHVEGIPLSPPEADEIQIAVRAFSLNFGDLLCLQGFYPNMPDYPFVPGFEVAGIVQQVGQAVSAFAPGDEVMALTGEALGGHATVVNTLASLAIKKPAGVDFEAACALPVVFMTAYTALEKATLAPGEKVLIQTAAGGVGLMAVQLAQQRGAEIFATAGTDEKCAYLKARGVKHVINYRQQDFAEVIQRLTGGVGMDVVLNTLSGEYIQKGLDSLAPGGRYIEIAMTGLKSAVSMDLSKLADNQSLHTLDLRRLFRAHREQVQCYLQVLAKGLADGSLTATIARVFSFAQLRQAYQYLAEGRNIGKVVVSTADMSAPTPPTPIASGAQQPQGKNGWQDIAIIGMAGRFPGASDVTEFWENLIQGRSTVTEIPPQRWAVADHYDPDPDSPNKTYSKWGGFLDDIDCFDPQFFKLSGREAALMDPQQRLFLESCWSALEDAGYSRHQLENRPYGVFLGGASGDYPQTLQEAGVPAQGHIFMGNDASINAARIAYLLDLKGPALAINTACSSSLVAVHLACQSLQQGESEVALAGGVFITTTPRFHVFASKAGMLSPDGKCKTFDNHANGFVPGEGVGTIVLKPLAQAVTDGDHIYGVIRGSGLNQDGKTNGITAPSTVSQTDLEKKVYEQSRINPETITYVETHGTGTKLGDPIEIEALTNAFRPYTRKKQFCAIGSVKTNIGHLATAAGIAGIIKVLLALKHRQLPPSLHFEQPNEHIDFEQSPFYVNTELKDWDVESGPRRAAVSSFGFSGTNAHLVIEEYQGTGDRRQGSGEGLQLIVLSARNEERLRVYSQKLLAFLDKASSPERVEGEPIGMAHTLSIEQEVRAMLSEIVGVAPSEIEREQPFAGYGLDPVQLNRLKTMVEAQYQCELSLTLFTTQASMGSVTQHLASLTTAKAYRPRVPSPPALSLASLAYTLQVGREAMASRLAIVAEDIATLRERLSAYLADETVEHLYCGQTAPEPKQVGVFAHDEDLQIVIGKWIRTRKLGKLAELWVSGVDIDWGLLHGSPRPNRISLPTYPFARERYWIPGIDERSDASVRNDQKVSTASEPTLQNQLTYIPHWIRESLPAQEKDSQKSSGDCLVVFHKDGFGFEQTILQQEINPLQLCLGNRTEEMQDAGWVVDVNDPVALATILKSMPSPDRIFFLGGLYAHQPEEDFLEGDLIEERAKYGLISLLRLIQALYEQGVLKQVVELFIFTQNAYRVSNRMVQPYSADIAGMVYGIAHTFPNLALRHIDLSSEDLRDQAMHADLLQQIVQEPVHHRGQPVVLYRGSRFVRRFTPCHLEPLQSSLKENGVYVLVGGAGTIGEAISRELVKRYQAQVIWLGRRKLDHLIQAKIDQIATWGPAPVYIQADVTEQHQLQSAFTEIKTNRPQINGVIHCGLVISKVSLTKMTEADLEQVIAVKKQGSLNLCRVLDQEALDFICFFSSAQAFSFSGALDLSHYAAGTTFMDALAQAIRDRSTRPVITLNWGFWRSALDVESIATLETMGVGLLEDIEGFDIFEKTVGCPLDQIIGMRMTDKILIETDPAEANRALRIRRLPATQPSYFAETIASLSEREEQCMRMERRQAATENLLDELIVLGLVQSLNRLGWRQHPDLLASLAALRQRLRILDKYDRLFEALLSILKRHQIIIEARNEISLDQARVEALEAADLRQLGDKLAAENSDLSAPLRLLTTCLAALPDVLMGKTAATDLLFPGSSVAMVVGIYQATAITDYFNEGVADVVARFVEKRRKDLAQGEKVRILEIGAGTGGTSTVVFKYLQDYKDAVDYVYTDISPRFLKHAAQLYLEDAPYLRFQRFDVEKPLAQQSLSWGQFDVVIAANVLHATRDMNNTLRQAKALLKKNGLLVVNELSANQDFATVTFGLLDGWWLYEDKEIRLPHCPGLAPETWAWLLTEQGFSKLDFVAESAHRYGQQLIVAESDGVVVQQVERPEGIRAPLRSREFSKSNEREPANPIESYAVSAVSLDALRDKAMAWFKRVLSQELKLAPEGLELEVAFQEYGVDSLILAQLVTRIERELPGVTLDPSIILANPTIQRLSAYLVETYPAALGRLVGKQQEAESIIARPSPMPSMTMVNQGQPQQPQLSPIPVQSSASQKAKIAVIGLACHFPDAPDIKQFWANLKEGRDSIREVPTSRWDVNQHFHPHTYRQGKSISKWGAFLDGIEDFDPAYFGISETLAPQIDPLERQWLEVSVEALADAGYGQRDLWGKAVGVFVGARSNNFAHKLEHLEKDVIVGVGQNFIAAHLAHFYNFKGPNMVVDTACASSLTAIHLAVQSLSLGESTVALAGGVDILLDESSYLALSAAQVLSPDGRCKTFDKTADGIGVGEGCGVLVLKVLEQAIADGNKIYGVIEGSAINQDGNTMGITTPNPEAQQTLIERVLDVAQVNPRTITYIETHGTGTLIGDPIELKGLSNAFSQDTHDRQFCGVGSVKSNIGHLFSAAGAAGVIKVLLSMAHKQLPPTLHCERPNPRFNFAESPFYPVQALTDWAGEAGIHRAGVSAFGLGGHNAHLIVSDEEIPSGHRADMKPRGESVVFNRKRYWPEAEKGGRFPESQKAVHRESRNDDRKYKETFMRFFEEEQII